MPRCFDVEKLKLTDFMIIHGTRPTVLLQTSLLTEFRYD
jgi:hypothetical protein